MQTFQSIQALMNSFKTWFASLRFRASLMNCDLEFQLTQALFRQTNQLESCLLYAVLCKLRVVFSVGPRLNQLRLDVIRLFNSQCFQGKARGKHLDNKRLSLNYVTTLMSGGERARDIKQNFP